MRIFNVKKLLELAEECNNDKKFLLSEWVSSDDLLELITSEEWGDVELRKHLTNSLSNEKTEKKNGKKN